MIPTLPSSGECARWVLSVLLVRPPLLDFGSRRSEVRLLRLGRRKPLALLGRGVRWSPGRGAPPRSHSRVGGKVANGLFMRASGGAYVFLFVHIGSRVILFILGPFLFWGLLKGPEPGHGRALRAFPRGRFRGRCGDLRAPIPAPKSPPKQTPQGVLVPRLRPPTSLGGVRFPPGPSSPPKMTDIRPIV